MISIVHSLAVQEYNNGGLRSRVTYYWAEIDLIEIAFNIQESKA